MTKKDRRQMYNELIRIIKNSHGKCDVRTRLVDCTHAYTIDALYSLRDSK
jgi:hypothetical protein